jgi:tRNA 2-thiocytidine biosynthesis protein TtcA
MNTWLHKTVFRWFKKAVEDYHLLEDGEKVLIAVSGGADSVVLLHLFDQYNRRRKKNWEVLAVHINPNFPILEESSDRRKLNWKTKPMDRLFKSLALPYLIEDIDIIKKLAIEKFKPCYICSRERRRKLFEIADKYQIKKIAFAHHMEDVVETYLLNLFYTSKTSTFIPKQNFFQGKYYIIRPLYFFDKGLIQRYLQAYHLKPVKNPCPYAKSSERERIRKMLKKFYSLDKRVKTNIFWGIKNIKPNYLPN